MSIDLQTKWVPRPDTFGARLALVRWRMGWNLKEAALACGFPEGNWREWETNGRVPRNIAEVALQISEHTRGVDDYWLMTGRMSGAFPDGPGSVTGLYRKSHNTGAMILSFPAKNEAPAQAAA